MAFQGNQAADQRKTGQDIAAESGGRPPFRNDIACQSRAHRPACVEYQGIHPHRLLELLPGDQVPHKRLLRGKAHRLVDAHDQPRRIQMPQLQGIQKRQKKQDRRHQPLHGLHGNQQLAAVKAVAQSGQQHAP